MARSFPIEGQDKEKFEQSLRPSTAKYQNYMAFVEELEARINAGEPFQRQRNRRPKTRSCQEDCDEDQDEDDDQDPMDGPMRKRIRIEEGCSMEARECLGMF